MYVWLFKLHRLSPLRSLISRNTIITSISFLSTYTNGSSECNECTSRYWISGEREQKSNEPYATQPVQKHFFLTRQKIKLDMVKSIFNYRLHCIIKQIAFVEGAFAHMNVTFHKLKRFLITHSFCAANEKLSSLSSYDEAGVLPFNCNLSICWIVDDDDDDYDDYDVNNIDNDSNHQFCLNYAFLRLCWIFFPPPPSSEAIVIVLRSNV